MMGKAVFISHTKLLPSSGAQHNIFLNALEKVTILIIISREGGLRGHKTALGLPSWSESYSYSWRRLSTFCVGVRYFPLTAGFSDVSCMSKSHL